MNTDRFVGCLLGGAIGDALGASVEFLNINSIKKQFGPSGIADFFPIYGRLGAITDDTQMTLFTAEGVIEALEQDTDPIKTIIDAYRRWLRTQQEQFDGKGAGLLAHPEIWSRRGPGKTCLTALRMDQPVAYSKGCGGVMRVAPIGLAYAGTEAFLIGCKSAALTHGHPTGYLASGALALIISAVIHGASLPDAINQSRDELSKHAGHEETLAAIDHAGTVASSASPVNSETVETLGAGWIAEEALAIALFCALRAEDFSHGVRLAVNHSGDSDSTGAICGNLLGAAWGVSAIPAHWLDAVELHDTIVKMAEELYRLVR